MDTYIKSSLPPEMGWYNNTNIADNSPNDRSSIDAAHMVVTCIDWCAFFINGGFGPDEGGGGGWGTGVGVEDSFPMGVPTTAAPPGQAGVGVVGGNLISLTIIGILPVLYIDIVIEKT